ncbi:uncharacterized protein RSE6_11776 [Rhynchosporium secalis]|uniref:Uncharacterized protein n=1 Tax=Rhynchosporium secalis TaxID=38038 RepID=A0A1E1MNR6_RHYSE|nr:uncharacterized protein RSE6_11776 [Rhynchosporium secalis]
MPLNERIGNPFDNPQASPTEEVHIEITKPHIPLPDLVLTEEETASAQAYDSVADAAVEQAKVEIEIDYGSDTTSESGFRCHLKGRHDDYLR